MHYIEIYSNIECHVKLLLSTIGTPNAVDESRALIHSGELNTNGQSVDS